MLLAASSAMASEYHGLVSFGGLPVPGATVTITQGGKKFVTVTDTQGLYTFPALADGAATVVVEMTGFSPIKQDVAIAPNAGTGKWELQLMSLDAMRAALKPVPSADIMVAQAWSEPKKTSDAPKPQGGQAPAPVSEETAQRAADGLLVNGSMNSAATSQFTLAQRLGNTASGKSLYNFMLNLRVDNSALDARSYSLAGIKPGDLDPDGAAGSASEEPDSAEQRGASADAGEWFNLCPGSTAQTFGVDPNYRVGYAQTWNLKIQRDLPGSLQMLATYTGIKGTRGAQLFLPNTNPAGAVNPCPRCPVGFAYLTSNGNSTREAGQIQLRTKLHSGFTAAVLYTYSKSIDDDSALGAQGAVTQAKAAIAQDWRNLRAERGLSTFDQRHLVNVVVQYTTGMGAAGGTLLTGWRGRLYKEWTVQTQISAGSGLPQTPIDSSLAVAGYLAFVRPNVTGAPLYAAPAGVLLNPAAYSAPPAGQWGNARRGGITGPGQFSLNAAMARTFRVDAKVNLDLQIAATNAFNHVSYTGWIPNINSTQFGLPAAANAMRSVQTSLRLRF